MSKVQELMHCMQEMIVAVKNEDLKTVKSLNLTIDNIANSSRVSNPSYSSIEEARMALIDLHRVKQELLKNIKMMH